MRTSVAVPLLLSVLGVTVALVAILGVLTVREPDRYCLSRVTTEVCWIEAEYAARVRGQIDRYGWRFMCAPVSGSHLYHVKDVDISKPNAWQTGRELAVRVIIAECAAWPEEERGPVPPV